MDGPVYLLTFGTYGSRLHGDPRGAVDRNHNQVGEPFLRRDDFRHAFETRLMKSPKFEIQPEARRSLEFAFTEVASFREWTVLALNIRMTHIHAVIAGETSASAMIGALKAFGTRRLRAEGIVGRSARVWAAGGSGRLLRRERDVETAVDYVANRQGELLAGSGPLHQLGRRAGQERRWWCQDRTAP